VYEARAIQGLGFGAGRSRALRFSGGRQELCSGRVGRALENGVGTQGTDTQVKPFPLRIRSKGCMRRARFKAEASVQVAHYHCVSRVVDRNFVLGELEKETFVKLMRRYDTYCEVRVLSFCVMTNHF